MMMKKRLAAAAAAVAVALSLALGGCSTSGGKENVLNIFTWADYFPADILEEFTQQTGAQINYSTFESNEEMLMKLQAGDGGQYDIVLASDYIIDIARKENLVAKLDKNKIPNYKNLDPQLQGFFYDENSEYTVPYSAGIPQIIYDPEKVGFEITGFEDLWNPALKDSVVVMDDARNVIGLTLKTMGESLNTTDPAVLEQAKAKLMELKPNIRALDYSTPYNLMLSGETSVGYMFTSQILTVINEQPGFKVVSPKEGSGFGIDACFIPAKAPHSDIAHKFLDFILDGERSAHITEQTLYISCNAAAKEFLTNDLFILPEGAIESSEFIMDIGETASLYDNIWSEFKMS